MSTWTSCSHEWTAPSEKNSPNCDLKLNQKQTRSEGSLRQEKQTFDNNRPIPTWESCLIPLKEDVVNIKRSSLFAECLFSIMEPHRSHIVKQMRGSYYSCNISGAQIRTKIHWKTSAEAISSPQKLEDSPDLHAWVREASETISWRARLCTEAEHVAAAEWACCFLPPGFKFGVVLVTAAARPCGERCQSIHHFDPGWSISTIIGRIAMWSLHRQKHTSVTFQQPLDVYMSGHVPVNVTLWFFQP